MPPGHFLLYVNDTLLLVKAKTGVGIKTWRLQFYFMFTVSTHSSALFKTTQSQMFLYWFHLRRTKEMRLVYNPTTNRVTKVDFYIKVILDWSSTWQICIKMNTKLITCLVWCLLWKQKSSQLFYKPVWKIFCLILPQIENAWVTMWVFDYNKLRKTSLLQKLNN